MKKITYIGITVLLIICVLSGCKAKTDDPSKTTNNSIGFVSASDMSCFNTYDDITIYSLTNKGLTKTNLVIPKNFETAEYDIFWNNENCWNYTLESISFKNPNFIIPADFFNQCFKLKKVKLPKNMTNIPYNTFYYCESLEEIELPEGIETIESKSFYECIKLKEVKFNEKIVSIEDEAFRHTSLKNVTLPNSLASIGEAAFADITTLENVVIPESVTSIAHNAFYYNDSDYAEKNKPKITVTKGSWADIHFDEYTAGGLYAEKVAN